MKLFLNIFLTISIQTILFVAGQSTSDLDCKSFRIGEAGGGFTIFSLPQNQICKFVMVTPFVGKRTMNITAKYDHPMQANRLDCPSKTVECLGALVQPNVTYNFTGEEKDPYVTTYTFSNLDFKPNEFKLLMTYDIQLGSSYAKVLGCKLLFGLSLIMLLGLI
ncbi:UNKNOWN [Stylonychia lemnae]|uniref:MD-2-related lipid-recognition domain-containing protein n=1 Tax=Stylonychia lemnae TaxID=5949 RepID=A0A077ZTI9_STYLE|nr:UNKNOWN [Stylonychia lemnae]|eukprot:CDW73202.1 UNKNOWN [Stylonychia lemnae]